MSQAQDRFLAHRFGIFNHFLYITPSDTSVDMKKDASALWNERVNSVDVKDLARRVHETGAGYYCITLMQGSRFMLAPNATYDEIAGTKPGEACAERDLPMELADALAEYDIDLFLYYTGDGPHIDQEIGPKFGFVDPRGTIPTPFVQKWAAVLEEYAVRYGSKVKGWWVDGCYEECFHYKPEQIDYYYNALKKGNPDCLTSFNNGVKEEILKYYPKEDFTCGEFNDFGVLPKSRFLDGAQSHVLIPLGNGRDEHEWSRWCAKGSRWDGPSLCDYIKRANVAGMPVTVDIFVGNHGEWDPDQFETMKYVGSHLDM